MMRTLQVPLKAAWDAAVAGAATDEAATAQRATRMRLADVLDIISTSVVCCPVGCHSQSVGTGNPAPNIYARRRHKFPRRIYPWIMIFFRQPVLRRDQVRGRLFRDHASTRRLIRRA